MYACMSLIEWSLGVSRVRAPGVTRPATSYAPIQSDASASPESLTDDDDDDALLCVKWTCRSAHSVMFWGAMAVNPRAARCPQGHRHTGIYTPGTPVRYVIPAAR